jgi:predicted amidohydrolase
MALITKAIETPASREPATALPLAAARPWVCRPEIAPYVGREENGLRCESNGSEGCYGGWELVFRGPWPAERLRFELAADGDGLPRGADSLVAEAFWHDSPDLDREQIEWDPLFLVEVTESGAATRAGGADGTDAAGGAGGRLHVRYANTLRVPPRATELRVRCGLRWADRGRVRWHGWRLDTAPPAPPHRRLRLGAASAQPPAGAGQAGLVAFFVEQCRRAGEAGLDLVCLPELILSYGIARTPQAAHAAALPIPGAWMAPFQDVARRYRTGICFSVHERAGRHGETVYNTAVLFGRGGELIGTYRKVHLALAEARNGIAAGHEFPVFDFDGVTVGLAICMDSTPLETARLLARRGAEVLLMPIMGDFRATPWEAGNGRFHQERWEAIQRAHALDNHLFVVVARNTTRGSAVTAPWGEILAWDGGDRGLVWADVDVDDVRSHPRGSTIRSVIWSMRRPALYGDLANPVPYAPAPAAARQAASWRSRP